MGALRVAKQTLAPILGGLYCNLVENEMGSNWSLPKTSVLGLGRTPSCGCGSAAVAAAAAARGQTAAILAKSHKVKKNWGKF